MRNLIIASVAIWIILAVGKWMFFGDATAPAATSGWQGNLDLALSEGQRLHRPVLTLLTRADSEPARRFETEVLMAPMSQTAMAPFVAVRIDAGKEPGVARRLHVQTVPWIVIHRENRIIDSFPAPTEADAFAMRLARALEIE
jgi:thioredoxin-like negative regulator of GroEL